MASLLLSFGPCSNAPKPMVLNLPVAEIVAKSAILVSIFKSAAIPPLLSISANRSSLNQTSPFISLSIKSIPEGFLPPLVLFLTPTIKVRINPKLGFPRTPIFILFGPSL